MIQKHEVTHWLARLPVPISTESLRARLISCLDLTELRHDMDPNELHAFCQTAETAMGSVAAVCLPPQLIPAARQHLATTPIKLASVANFPSGQATTEQTCKQIENCLQQGADEIDIVFPYMKFLQGDRLFCYDYLAACRKACGQKIMKVILETGALADNALIYAASQLCLETGASFIKTSTGTTQPGATTSAACAILLAIRDNGSAAGLKVSGGIKNVTEAASYYQLYKMILGSDTLHANHFRIGASSLLKALLSDRPQG